GYEGGKLGDSGGPGFGWEDMTIVKLGVDYQLNSTTVLRAGWNHGEQPIPAGETAFNVIAPAVVEDHLTLGATFTLANKAELSAYFMHAFENEVKGDSPGTTSAAMNNAGHGDLKMSQDALGIAYGWKF
ncbi:MAG: outer membrane protein transport protein, partial [Gammaproteobacteria bacterium]|nr:outer membrane protein transport protein [Gammaproteobacteria bacterium]